MKLNLLAFGVNSTKIVEKLYDENDCVKTCFSNNLDSKNDLESNEKAINADLLNQISYNEDNISETYCFIDGSSPISGISLTILELFKSKPITIFYFKKTVTNVLLKTNDKIAFQVLQEYSRSGLFKCMIIFDMDMIYNHVLNSISDDIEFNLNELLSLVFDKILFAVNIYWRINNEDNIENIILDYDNPNYKIQTFFETSNYDNKTINIIPYYNLNYNLNVNNIHSYVKIYCLGVKKDKMSKKDLINLSILKNNIQEEGAESISLSSDNGFVVGFVGTKIIQEQSSYLI